jgi:hypothetical protein
MRGDRKPVPTGITADDDEFKTDISTDVHDKDEEMADLLGDKSNASKRRG